MVPCDNCTGCGACVNVCPTGAIRFAEDREGFPSPTVNSARCIQCGKCRSICPVVSPLPGGNEQFQTYAARAVDDRLRAQSSSGGVFSLLARQILAQGGIAAGCAMAPDCRSAHHIAIISEQDLQLLRGSKYLASNASGVMPQIKDALRAGKPVLFSGTPCQVAGLRAFLKDTDTAKLVTVDVICHGVPSVRVWREYLNWREKRQGSRAVAVKFRDKTVSWKIFSLSIQFENGTHYRQTILKDLYLRGFVDNLFLRNSCYRCPFKAGRAGSDLTLADFWGVDKVCAGVHDPTGVSLVLVHTPAGQKLWDAIQPELTAAQTDVQASLKRNPSYYHSVPQNRHRDKFISAHTPQSLLRLLHWHCSQSLPIRVMRKITKIIGG